LHEDKISEYQYLEELGDDEDEEDGNSIDEDENTLLVANDEED